MPRLQNVSSDAIVDVPDEKVAALGSSWEPVKDEPTKKPAAKRSSSTKK